MLGDSGLVQHSFHGIAEEAVNLLKRMKISYPHLISPYVDAAIENWRGRFPAQDAGMAVEQIQLNDEEMLPKVASELLEIHQMEDVLEMLSERFSIDADYDLLISLVGKEGYKGALCREADEMINHAISTEQIADLWNSLGKPGPGGQLWTSELITSLLY